MKKLLIFISFVLLSACSKEDFYKSVDFKITNVSAVSSCWLQIHEYDASHNPVCTEHIPIDMGKGGYFYEGSYHANVNTMIITLEISADQLGGSSSMWYPYPIPLGSGYYDPNKCKEYGDPYYDVILSAYDFTGKHDPIWDL